MFVPRIQTAVILKVPRLHFLQNFSGKTLKMAAAEEGESKGTIDDNRIKQLCHSQDLATNNLLEYELTIFTDLQAEDGLVITAK